MINDWSLNQTQREEVERKLAASRDELWIRLISPPDYSRDGLARWRKDLAVRRKEIARLERLLG